MPDLGEVVVTLLAEAGSAMFATVGVRKAIDTLHQDLDNLTSHPTLPRQECSEFDQFERDHQERRDQERDQDKRNLATNAIEAHNKSEATIDIKEEKNQTHKKNQTKTKKTKKSKYKGRHRSQ